VRPSQAWARRRRRGDGVGDLNQCGARDTRAMACAGERARKVTTTASEGVGRDRGVAAGNAAEPGSTPWVAASTAPAVGSRVRARGSAGGKVCSRWPKKRCLSPSPLRPCARGTRPRQGRSGAAVPNAAVSPTREKRGPRFSLAPGVDMRACWGARWRGGVGFAWPRARTRARTARRGVADASGTARRTTATKRG
jgi:hypothetical protein